MSLVKDVKIILQNNNLKDQIFLSNLPDIDNCVAIYATGGYERDKAGNMIEQPTFQVRVRNKDYEKGWSIIENIKDILVKPTDVIINNNRYLGFYQQSDILDMGTDERGRAEFTINFRCFVHRKYNQ